MVFVFGFGSSSHPVHLNDTQSRPHSGRTLGAAAAPLWVAAILLAFCCGCRPAGQQMPGARAELRFEPSPPVVGTAEVLCTLTTAGGQPLPKAEVRIEGNMNHAGMKPTFASLREVEPGRYAGSLEFTMGGDWFVIVTARMPDGRVLERKVDVPGVQTP